MTKGNEMEIARAEAQTEGVRRQRDLALKLYEDQIKTSTKLGYLVAEMLQALKAAEWGGPESVLLSEEDAAGSRCCPVCCVWNYDGRHHPDCILSVAIKKAKGEG